MSRMNRSNSLNTGSNKRQGSPLFRVLSVVFSFILFAAFGLIAFFYMHKMINDMQALRMDQTRVHQENLAQITQRDVTTGKILLNEDYLAEEYRFYHEGVVSEARTFRNILKAVILVVIGFSLFSFIFPILKSAFRGERLSIMRMVTALIPIIFVIAFYFIVGGKMISNTKPEPDKASYLIYRINVLSKKMITTTDSDGDSHTEYKVYYENSSGGQSELDVRSDMYNTIREAGLPSEYYLVQAGDGSDSRNFAFYPLEEYEYVLNGEVH